MDYAHGFDAISKRTGLALIISCVALAGTLQFFSSAYFPEYHDLLRHTYYIPIFLGGYFYGKSGSLYVSSVAGILFFIHMFFHGHIDLKENILQLFVLVSFGLFVGYFIDKIKQTNLLLFRSEMDFFKGLSNVLDSRDTYTEGHSVRVANIARLIGSAMGLNAQKLDNLYQSGLLHDIGKVGIPDSVLKKEGKLTESEYKLIQTHPIIAESIMKDIEVFDDILKIVKHHHERHDGSGYPDGLKGNEIPLGARIISVADTFDAITSQRIYSTRKNTQKAIDIIVSMSGTQFDPEVVCIFQSQSDQVVNISQTAVFYYSDPVCKMQVTPDTSAKSYEEHGTTYYFCSNECYKIFTGKMN